MSKDKKFKVGNLLTSRVDGRKFVVETVNDVATLLVNPFDKTEKHLIENEEAYSQYQQARNAQGGLSLAEIAVLREFDDQSFGAEGFDPAEVRATQDEVDEHGIDLVDAGYMDEDEDGFWMTNDKGRAQYVFWDEDARKQEKLALREQPV